MKHYYIYIVCNKTASTIYIGVTSDLKRRIYEHKNKIIKGFTSRYNTDELVYFETYNRIEDAICREKQLKGWSRKKKNELITTINPSWKDLYEELIS